MAGGTLSEGDESEEENVEKLQGIIRFSFFFLSFPKDSFEKTSEEDIRLKRFLSLPFSVEKT